jgi:FKBP-type peptidyl-prolyl cis-trans isomerase SlyD
MSDKIAQNMVVGFTYTLKDAKGQVLDESTVEPLEYLHGFQNIIPGLEVALEGLQIGDKKDVTVQPDQGYGLWEAELIQPFPKSAFPEDLSLEIGMELEAESGHGPIILRVKDIQENQVLMDGNHPLAGEVLNFQVEIKSIRQAAKEEIEHGHVHSKGHHHH